MDMSSIATLVGSVGFPIVALLKNDKGDADVDETNMA